jgi:hypothetical protein
LTSRREILAGLAATIVGAASRPALASTDYDLDDPAASLEAYIKLRGDLSGRPVFDMVQGEVLGLVAGEPARPLFRMLGAQVSRYQRSSPLEYAASTRYLGLLNDPQTNRRLQTWVNPYNGKTCEVPMTRYGPAEVRFLTDRMLPANVDAPADVSQGPRPWYLMGDVVHMVDQVFSPAPAAALPDADFMTFSGSWSRLNDPALTRIPARLSFTAVEHWRDWMGMDQPGSLLWHVTGVKLGGPAEYPDELRTLLEQQDPPFFEENDL